MHSAFNLFVFPNYMFTSLLLFLCVCMCFLDIFYERAMSSPEKKHLKITIILITIIGNEYFYWNTFNWFCSTDSYSSS